MLKRVLVSGCVLTIFMGAHLDDISNAEIPVSQDQTSGAAVAKKQAPEVQMARRPSSKASSGDFDSKWIVEFGGITGGSASSLTSDATSDADSTPKELILEISGLPVHLPLNSYLVPNQCRVQNQRVEMIQCLVQDPYQVLMYPMVPRRHPIPRLPILQTHPTLLNPKISVLALVPTSK